MNDKANELAAVLQELLHRFTIDEIYIALDSLAARSANDKKISGSHRSVHKTGRAKKPVERAAALSRLEKSDPEKFSYLVDLETRIRSRQVFSQAAELIRVSRAFDKDFKPRKKWDDSVSALMTILAKRPLSELRSRLPQLLENASMGSNDAYQHLARELMGPKGSK